MGRLRVLFHCLAVLALATSCNKSSTGRSLKAPSVVDPNCSSKTAQTCSTNQTCVLNGNQCTGSADYCGGFTTVGECPSGSCAWSSSKSSCVVLSADAVAANPSSGSSTIPSTIPSTVPSGLPGAIPTTPGPSPVPAPTPVPGTPVNYCSPYTTAALCGAGPGCVWSGTSCSLIGSGAAPQPKTCSPFTTAELCGAGLGCKWTGTVCNRPSVGLSTPFVVGDGIANIGTSVNGVTNCNFSAIFQSNGNLVINQGNAQIWSSLTSTKGATKLVFQSDGNLVMYNAANAGVWASGTSNRGAVGLFLSTSGSLVIVDASNNVLWTSGPSVTGCQ